MKQVKSTVKTEIE